MNASLFLARLLGPTLIIVGAGLLLNTPHYRAMVREFVGSRPLMYIGAAVGLIAGLAIILVHNVWAADWRVIITLLGWINFLRGALSIVFPAQAEKLIARMAANKNFPMIQGAVALVIGLALSYFGNR